MEEMELLIILTEMVAWSREIGDAIETLITQRISPILPHRVVETIAKMQKTYVTLTKNIFVMKAVYHGNMKLLIILAKTE